jgi:hypothetical protein
MVRLLITSGSLRHYSLDGHVHGPNQIFTQMSIRRLHGLPPNEEEEERLPVLSRDYSHLYAHICELLLHMVHMKTQNDFAVVNFLRDLRMPL